MRVYEIKLLITDWRMSRHDKQTIKKRRRERSSSFIDEVRIAIALDRIRNKILFTTLSVFELKAI